MELSADHRWGSARGPAPMRGRRGIPGQPSGDEDTPRRARAGWILAVWAVAGSMGLFALLFKLQPALGTSDGAAPKEWDLAFQVASDGEPRRPMWLREQSAAASGTLPDGSGGRAEETGEVKSAVKRDAESDRAPQPMLPDPGRTARSARARTSVARVAGVTGLIGPESASDGGPGADRNYRVRRTSVLEEARRKPVRLAPPPRRVDVRPEPEHNPRPQYPVAAKKNEIEGSVKVKLLVSEKGTVSRWEFLAADPPGVFEKCIQDVLPVWRYRPALDQFGKPIECWRELNLTFKFEDAR